MRASIAAGNRQDGRIVITWDSLDERSRLALSRAALDRAIGLVASHADSLARDIESGCIPDQGGVEALRLFASLTRCSSLSASAIYGQIAHGLVGHA